MVTLTMKTEYFETSSSWTYDDFEPICPKWMELSFPVTWHSEERWMNTNMHMAGSRARVN